MNLLDAAKAVLTESGEPLHYGEITRRMLDSGLWTSTGRTPDATVNAQLAVDVKQRGPGSPFQRTARGVFALRSWGLPEFHSTSQEAAPTASFSDVTPISTSAKTLSFSDAAEQVLEQFAQKRPMHYRAITEKALDIGLVRTQGQTPEATLYAQILTEIDRATRRGDTPRFVKHGKGHVGLSRWEGHGLAYQIERHNADIRMKLRHRLFAVPPAEFEALVGRLLIAIGFEDVSVTSHSADGGIDVRGTLVVGDVIRTRMAVQVKRWKANVQAPTVQQVRGSLGTHQQGLIITTSDFSTGARTEAERPNAVPVALMNGRQLVALLVEHDIGVRRESHDLIELDETESG